MKVIVDTNILFSSIVKQDGKIAEIILNPNFDLQKMGCYFSYIELLRHKLKLIKISRLSEIELLDVVYRVIKNIEFVNESQIPHEIIEEAYFLTKNIDEKDTIFVAMSLFLNASIWTGDKILLEGLRKKGFNNICSTNELLDYLNTSK